MSPILGFKCNSDEVRRYKPKNRTSVFELLAGYVLTRLSRYSTYNYFFYKILISICPNFSVTSEHYSFSHTSTISDKKLKTYYYFFPCAPFSPTNKLETYLLCGYFIGQNAQGSVLISIPPHTMVGEG
jgi:hypothetical protein